MEMRYFEKRKNLVHMYTQFHPLADGAGIVEGMQGR